MANGHIGSRAPRTAARAVGSGVVWEHANVRDETGTGQSDHRRSDVWDVLVVGGGPAGAATAAWLADHGHRVLVVEKKRFPREKTCGDGLTPRAVRQLHDLGLAGPLAEYQRYAGLRSIAHGVTLELAWPEHPDFPSYGYVVRRRDLDQMVAERAVKGGATLWPASEAVEPLVEDGLVAGAVVQRRESGTTERVRARYVVVADGANSRFGRALGTSRDRSYPLGMAIRGYFTSPMHDEPWIESHLDLRDRDGNHLPGYGWVFPVGDGTVNVGVGLLNTYTGWKDVNTSRLMDAFVHTRSGEVGHLARFVLWPAHRGQAAHRRIRDPEGRARRGSSSATRAAPSTRSTARASPTRTRPAGTRRMRSTRRW